MQDEITKGKGDSPQTPGLTPPAEGEITPGGTERQYSEKDVQKLISDERAKFGREKVQLVSQFEAAQGKAQSLQGELETTTGRLDTVEREIRQSKLDRGNPESIQLFQEKEALLTEKRNLEKEQRAVRVEKARLEEDRKTLTAKRIADIAGRHGVEVADLEALGTENLEVIERFAKAIAAIEKVEAEGKKDETEFIPDSGIGTGSPGALTVEQAENLSDEQYFGRRKKEIYPPKK